MTMAQAALQGAMTEVAFGVRLSEEIERSGIPQHHVANNCRVAVGVLRDWLRGELTPTRPEFQRLVKTLPRMRFFPPVFRVEADKAPSSEPPAVVEPRPLPAQAPKPKTFGEALRQERELEELSLRELGELCGVANQSVSQWETDSDSPVKENYDKLLELFPRLKDAPQPNWRNIPVPDGGKGVPRSRSSDPSAPSSSRKEPNMNNVQPVGNTGFVMEQLGGDPRLTPLASPSAASEAPLQREPSFDEVMAKLLYSIGLAGVQASLISFRDNSGQYVMRVGDFEGVSERPVLAAALLQLKLAEPIRQQREALRTRLDALDEAIRLVGIIS